MPLIDRSKSLRLGAVEDHAGEAGADRRQVAERLLDQRALLPAGDGQDDAVGRGAHQARLDAAEDRAGVDQDRSRSACLASSISRRSACGESVLAW